MAAPGVLRLGFGSSPPVGASPCSGFDRVNDVFVNPTDWPVLQRNGLDRLDAFFLMEVGQSLSKPGLRPWRERRWVVLSDGCGRERTYFLKRYMRPPLSAQVRRVLCGSRRWGAGPSEAANAAALQAAGVRTYHVAAFGQRFSAGFEKRSFVLIAALAGESLERWWPEQRQRLCGRSQSTERVSLIDELAGFVAHFHAAGFVHRDLYFSHVFVDPTAPIGERFSLIDLGRVFRPRWRRRRWVVKDLAELDFSAALGGVTRADRLRFLRVYLRAGGSSESWRWLASSVGAKSRRIAAHHFRRIDGDRGGPGENGAAAESPA